MSFAENSSRTPIFATAVAAASIAVKQAAETVILIITVRSAANANLRTTGAMTA